MIRSIFVGLHLSLTLGATPVLKQKVPTTTSFLVMGDWGGQDTHPFTTQAQRDVAVGMGSIAGKLNSKFVLALGDNFYSSGVHGDCYDARFNATFDSVYTAPGLNTPFYVLPGNHDHLGNISAQVEFTNVDPTQRWKMPQNYYSVVVESLDWTAEFVMIDTVVLGGNSDLNETEPQDLLGATTQLEWIEATLEASTADFLFVGGHYSVYSGGSHGSDPNLGKNVLPLLQKYNATAYMSGHDHTAQYLTQGGISFIQQGAGHSCCYNNVREPDLPKDVDVQFHLWNDGSGNPEEGSFSSITLTQDKASVSYYAPNGTELFTATMPSRTLSPSLAK